MPDHSNLKKVYDKLIADGEYNLPATYEQFEADMSDGQNLQNFYTNLRKTNKYGLPKSFLQFKSDMGFDVSQPAEQPQEAQPAQAPTPQVYNPATFAPMAQPQQQAPNVRAPFANEEAQRQYEQRRAAAQPKPQPTQEQAQPLGPERFKKLMDMQQAVGKMQADFNKRLDDLRNNKPFGQHTDALAPARQRRMQEEAQKEAEESLNIAMLPLTQSDMAVRNAWMKADQQTKEQWKAFRFVGNEAAYQRNHDIDKMSEDAWNNIDEQAKQRAINNVARVLVEQYGMGRSDAYSNAEKIVRGQSDKMMYDEAVRQNAPKGVLDYMVRKINDNNFGPIVEGLARMKSGTIGDMQARDEANQQYRKENWLGGLVGDVAGLTSSLGMYAAGGAASGAVKAGTKMAVKQATKKAIKEGVEKGTAKMVGEAAVRQSMEKMANKIVQGAVSSAINLGVFNALGEAANQFRYGGEITGVDENGRYVIGGYNPGAIGMSALEGAGTGLVIGPTGQLIGNVGNKLVGRATKTAEKAAIRGAQTLASIVTGGTIFTAPEMLKGDLTFDDWLGSVELMAAFKLQGGLKSAPQRIKELAGKNGNSRRDLMSRLNTMLENRPDLALSRDERYELERGGYGDLADLVEGYKNATPDQRKAIELKQPVFLEANEDGEIPYNRFIELVQDKNISEAARAKMYYYVTGHGLPQSTILGSNFTEYKDQNGNVTGYEVQSFGKDNGVITSRTFKNKAEAEAELARINRQAELNGINMGEQAYDSDGDRQRMWDACQVIADQNGVSQSAVINMVERVMREPDKATDMEREWTKQVMEASSKLDRDIYQSAKALQESVGKEYGVDVEAAIGKDAYRRSEQEKKAVKDYLERLFADAMSDNTYNNKQIEGPFKDGYDADEQQRSDIAIEAAEGKEGAEEAWRGVQQRISDDADMMAAEQREEAKKRQYKDGSIHPATLKETDADGNPKEVFVVDGDVTMDDEGNISGGENIVVYDPLEGKNRFLSPSEIAELGEVTTAEQQEQNIEANKQAYIQQQMDKAEGKLMPDDEITYAEGQTVKVLEVGPEESSVLLPDGQVTTMPTETLQAAKDAKIKASYQERNPEEQKQPTATNETETKEETQSINEQPGADFVEVTEDTPKAKIYAPEAILKATSKRDGSVHILGVVDGTRYHFNKNTKKYEPSENGNFVKVVDSESGEERYLNTKGDYEYTIDAYLEPADEVETPTEEQPAETTEDNTNTVAPSVAAEWLLGSGLNAINSTDYLLKALSGVFPNATNAIEAIRKKYKQQLNETGNAEIDNFINSELYNTIIGEVRNAVNAAYVNKDEAENILNVILQYPKGLPNRVGTDISLRLEALNEAPTETSAQGEEPTPAENAMPMRKVTVGKGKNAKTETVPDFYDVPEEKTFDYIYNELGFAPEIADATVKANADETANAIKEHKGKEPKPMANPLAYKEAHDAWQRDLDAMQQQADYWKKVQGIRNQQLLAEAEARDAATRAERERRQKEIDKSRKREQEAYEAEMARRKAEKEKKMEASIKAMQEMSEEAATMEQMAKEWPIENDAEALEIMNDLSPRTLEEVAAWMLSDTKDTENKIDPELVREHTGYGPADFKKFPFIFKKGGMSPEAFGEKIEQMARENDVVFDENDTNAGFNALLNVLGEVGGLGDIKNYIKNNRIAESEKLHSDRLREAVARKVEDDWIAQHGGMSRNEYASYINWMEDAVEQRKNEISDEEYNQLFNTDYDRAAETNDERGNERGAEKSGADEPEAGQTGVAADVTRRDGEEVEPATEQPEGEVAEQLREDELASRMNVLEDEEYTTDSENGVVYHRPIVIDGKYRVEQVSEPDEKGYYTGSYYMYNGKRYGDLREVFDKIDKPTAEHDSERGTYRPVTNEWFEIGDNVGAYENGKVYHGDIIDWDGEQFTIRETISKRRNEYKDHKAWPINIKPGSKKVDVQSASTEEKPTADQREIGQAMVDQLENLGMEVSTDIAENRRVLKQAEQDKSEAGKLRHFRTPSGKTYGFVYRGKMHLDPRHIDAELPIHEYAHPWCEAMRYLSPERWFEVVDVMKADAETWDFIKRANPDLTDESDIAEEMIATFSGKNGKAKAQAEFERMGTKGNFGNVWNNIAKAIQDFWKKIGDFLNIKYESAEQVYDQVVKDFANKVNPRKRIEDYLKQRDAEYMQAVESGDEAKAKELFDEALRENIGNGMTPYLSVDSYIGRLKNLAKGVKSRDPKVIAQVAELMAPLIPQDAVLVPAPSHTGEATDMLDLAEAISKITGAPVANVLKSEARASQYQTKKESGQPITSDQMGITMEGTLPDGKIPVVIDNVVDSGNTAEACVKALGKGVVASLAESVNRRNHVATLKSANPVVRDRNGNVVPLSERFELGGSNYLAKQKVDGDTTPLTKVRKAINEQLDEVMGDMLGEDYVAAETPDEVAKAELEIVNGRPQMANPVFVSNAMHAVEGIKQEKATAEQWLKMIEKAGGLKAGEDKWTGLSEWLKEQKGSLTKQEVMDYLRKNAIQIEEVNYAEDVDVEEKTQKYIQETFAGGKSLEELQEEVNENADSADRYDKIGEDPDPDDLDEYLMECMVQEYGDDFRLGYAIEEGKIDYDAPSLIDTDNYDEYNREIADDNNKVINETRLNYTTDFLDNKREIALVVPSIDPWNENDDVHFGDAGEGRAVAWVRFGETTVPSISEEEYEKAQAAIDKLPKGSKEFIEAVEALDKALNPQRVLVIDEIQSKRHQEGRENGYKKPVDKSKIELEYSNDGSNYIKATYEGREEGIRRSFENDDAARDYFASVFSNNNGVPDAPFEKNWHELAMKRMLRYAAENGYDKVAWTKGEQQAERYDLSKELSQLTICRNKHNPDQYSIIGYDKYGQSDHNKIMEQDCTKDELASYIGKDLAKQAIESEYEDRNADWDVLDIKGDNLRIGGEGMKGFYDQILPRFMDKYGKKWGVKTGEVELPNIGDNGLTMWSVDVTPEMKQSVMEGQPMFQKVWHGSGADFERFDSSHMGEGEGAQAYGYGHYTTEVEGIGRTYAKASGDRNLGNRPAYIASRYDYFYKGQPIDQDKVNPLQMACGTAMDSKNIAEARRRADHYADYAELGGNTEMAEKWREAYRILSESKKSDFTQKPHKPDYYLYTVEIPDDNGSNYLEWEKPISEEQLKRIEDGLLERGIPQDMVESIRKGLRYKTNRTGQYVYHRIADMILPTANNPKQASEFLHSIGFTGIKYPAQFRSGGRKDNAKNYVIFDDNDLKINNKTRFFRTADGTAYGFTKDGKIYIDKRIATPETRIHEYAHLWAQGLKKRNPDAWKQLKSEMEKEADVMAKVKELYPELIDEKNPDHLTDEMMEELFAHYSGKRGAERLEKDMREEMANADGIIEKAKVANVFHKIREMLSKFWNMARDLFAGKVEGIEKLSGEDFSDMMLGDLLRGFDPRKEGAHEGIRQQKADAIAIAEQADAKNRGYEVPKREEGESLVDYAKRVADDYEVYESVSKAIDAIKEKNLVSSEKVRTFAPENQLSLFGENGTGEYETTDGEKLGYVSLLGQGTERADTDANRRPAGEDITGYSLRKLEPGETCNVERRYQETNQFDFTGKEKIESYDDVAYIFKQLQDAAVENAFVVLVKNGKPTVIHVGMGKYTESSFSIGQVLVAYRNINPDAVYMVHNHPSGAILPSKADVGTLQAMRKFFGEKLQDGIIIDTTSGKYGVFNDKNIYDGDMPSEVNGEVPVKVYQFSKQVFAEDWNPTTAFDFVGEKNIAEFISSHRLGEHQKMSLILINNQGKLIGNVFLPYTDLTKKNKQNIIDDIAYYGNQMAAKRAILYGNFGYQDKSLIKGIAKGLEYSEITLVDAVLTDSYGNLNRLGISETDVRDKSLRDEDMQIQKAGVNDSDATEPFKAPAKEQGEDMVSYAKRVADAYRVYQEGVPKIAAREAYERSMGYGANQFKEAVQDSMLSLKELYRAILGKDAKIEDVKGYENAYLAENRMHSASEAQAHAYQKDFIAPIVDEIYDIIGHGKFNKEKYDDLVDYMMAKHGLERNRVFAERDAQEASKKGADYDEELQKNQQRDYAGLTALTGESDVAGAEGVAQKMVDDYEANQDTTELWNRINRATKQGLYTLYSSGMMTKERYEQIRDMFDYYIPLQGFDSTIAEDVYAYLGSDGTLGYGTPIRTAKGRRSKADDPIATIAMNGEAAIRSANRNEMKKNFLNFVQNHPSDLVSVSEVWLKYNDVTGEWEQVTADLQEGDSPADVERKTKAFDEKMEQLSKDDPDHYKKASDMPNVPYRVVQSGNMKQHQVTVKRNGKDYVLTINGNPRAAQALNGLTNPDVFTEGVFGKAMNLGQWLNRQLSAFYTTRNPEFVLSNFLRDAIYSNMMVGTKEDGKYAMQFHKNFGKMNPVSMGKLFASWENGSLRDKVRNGTCTETERMFYDFMMNGGETGWTNMRDIEKHKKEIQSALKIEGSTNRKAWKALGSAFDLINRSAENCARFAAFVTSREMGRSLERSIWDAKEISVNFNKKGAGDKFLTANNQKLLGQIGAALGGLGRGLYVFWNASLQGLNNIARGAKRNPWKFAGRIVATNFLLGALMPILNEILTGGDDDDYYNLPEYIRRSNICFRFSKDMPWITIPLPIEFRAIYGLGELATGMLTGKEHYTDEEFAKQFVSQLSQVLPLDFMEGGGGWHAFVPSQLKPFVEAQGNKSWTGLPIYKDTPFNQNDPEWTKAYKSANKQLVEATKWLNDLTNGSDYAADEKKGWIDINPAKLEYMLKGYFGGYTTMLDRFVKTAETVFGDRDFEWRNIPMASRVLREGDERTANRKITNEYFNLLNEYNETKSIEKKKREKAESGDYIAKADYVAWTNFNENYKKAQVIDNFKPLLDALKDKKKNQSEYSLVEIEERENELRREMVELIHSIQDAKKGQMPDIETPVDHMLDREFDRHGYTSNAAASRIASRMGGTDGYGHPDMDDQKGQVYYNLRDHYDLRQDVAMQVAIKQAKDAGDDDRARDLDKARDSYNENKKDFEDGAKEAEQGLQWLRKDREQALKDFGIPFDKRPEKDMLNQ